MSYWGVPIPSSSVVPSLDFDIEGPGPGDAKRERTGAKSWKDSLPSIERRRRFMGRVSLAMLLAGAGAVTWIAGRPWAEDELKAKKLVRTELLSKRMAHTHAAHPSLASHRRRRPSRRDGSGRRHASLVSLTYVYTMFTSTVADAVS